MSQVPSPSNTLSPIPHAHSPTMFSPGGGGGNGDNSCKAVTTHTNTASTKYSPYETNAASRTAGGRRLSSAASTASTSSAPPPVMPPQPTQQFSLLESLAEFNALQNRIKVEREAAAPPPPPSYAESTKAAVKAEPGPSTSSMPPPPYNYYGGCVIKAEAASVSDDAEMESEGETAATPGGNFGGVGVGRMDPVLSLVMEQARKDIDFTCSALGISNGERQTERVR